MCLKRELARHSKDEEEEDDEEHFARLKTHAFCMLDIYYCIRSYTMPSNMQNPCTSVVTITFSIYDSKSMCYRKFAMLFVGSASLKLVCTGNGGFLLICPTFAGDI